jgi:hypothetical protein
VTAQLHAQENVLATLEVDLDRALHFVPGLVVLTNQRLAQPQWYETNGSNGLSWRAWICCTTTMRVSGT